jgi:hypothetical protein
MKNKIFMGLFVGLFGIFLFFVTVNVSAETAPGEGGGPLYGVEDGENTAIGVVGVGTVEVPIYEVHIIWQDLTFDWAYDEKTQEFGWRKPAVCTEYTQDATEAQHALDLGMELYQDGSCEKRIYTAEPPKTETEPGENAPTTDAAYYYWYETNKSVIGIEDFTQNGQIVPSVSWTSGTKYPYVNATLEYKRIDSVCQAIYSQDMLTSAIEEGVTLYSDSNCSSVPDTIQNEYVDNMYHAFVEVDTLAKVNGEIPDEARHTARGAYTGDYKFTESTVYYGAKDRYYIYLSLENDPTKEAGTPVEGEILGIVTVKIRAR